MQDKHILLVDDDTNLVRALGDFLRSHGYSLTQVGTAEAALETLETHAFDLILLDIEMPGMGGIGFLRRAFKENAPEVCPIIVLTARSDMGCFFQNLSVAGFLAKPFDCDVMLRTIEDVLSATEKSQKLIHGNKAVLLVENDAALSHSIISGLRAGEYHVSHAKNGPDALDLAPQFHPDVILIQNGLPDMNCETLTQLFALMPTTRIALRVIYNASPDAIAQSARPTKGAIYIAANEAEHVRREVDRLLSA